jgi:hypothetical protein
MIYIKKYEELDLSKFNPFKKNISVIKSILDELNLKIVSKSETSSKLITYNNYLIKLPIIKSMGDMYISIRMDEKETEYKIKLYFLFKTDITHNRPHLSRKLRQTNVTVIDRGTTPPVINNITRTNTLLKISLSSIRDNESEDASDSELNKQTLATKLKRRIQNIIDSSEKTYDYIISLIDKYDSDAIQEDDNRKVIERERKEKEEKQKIINAKRREHYQKILENIEDIFYELQDISKKDPVKSSTTDYIKYTLLINLNGKYSGDTDDILKAIMQAKKRILNIYPLISIELEINSMISFIIKDIEFNEKFGKEDQRRRRIMRPIPR